MALLAVAVLVLVAVVVRVLGAVIQETFSSSIRSG
jgi:hypothetical protein